MYGMDASRCLHGTHCTCPLPWPRALTDCRSVPAVARDGGWSSWQTGPCQSTCGSGVSVTVRLCTNPAPDKCGSYCPGPHGGFKSCSGLPSCCSKWMSTVVVVVVVVMVVTVFWPSRLLSVYSGGGGGGGRGGRGDRGSESVLTTTYYYYYPLYTVFSSRLTPHMSHEIPN